MATDYDINNSGRETNVMFGGISNNYTFVTTEGVLVDLNALNSNYSSASTTLLKVASTSKKILPLNSAIILPPKDKTLDTSWAKVGAKDNYMANMTVGAMTNDTKSFMVTSYADEAICISNPGKKSYQSCAAFDLGINSNSWRPSVGWDIPPTVYTKSSEWNIPISTKSYETKMPDTTNINAKSHTLFPKTPSPRWFRTAGIQRVKSEKYGDRLFFIYIDLLSTFYIYPVKNSVVKMIIEDGEEKPGEDPKVISRYLETSKYCINEGKYIKYDVEWDKSKKPTITDFHGFKELEISTLPYPYTPNKKYYYIDNDFTKIENSNNNKEFNNWMGGDDPKFKHDNAISTTQYVWTFNYNSTKVTTIAFEEGDSIQGKTLSFNTNDKKEKLYKLEGTPFIISESYKSKLGDNSSINTAPKLKDAKLKELKKYYPTLIEVSIDITITSEELEGFNVKCKTEETSSKETKVYYIGSGYTHPILNNKKEIKSGNELVHLAISCYGDFTSYSISKDNPEKSEAPHDMIFTDLKDITAKRDLPEKFLASAKDATDDEKADAVVNLAFLEMLITGKYDMPTIKKFVDRIVITKGVNGAKAPPTIIEKFTDSMDLTISSRYLKLDKKLKLDAKMLDILNADDAKDLRMTLCYLLKNYAIQMFTADHTNSFMSSIHTDISKWGYVTNVSGTRSKSKTIDFFKSKGFSLYVNSPIFGFPVEWDATLGKIYYPLEIIFKLLYLVGNPYYNDKGFSIYGLKEVYSELEPLFKMVKVHLTKSGALLPYLFRNLTLVNLLVQWYVITEIFEQLVKLKRINDTDKDIMLSIIAQGFFLDKKEIKFKYIETFVKNFFDRLPKMSTQVIGDILVSNMTFTIADSLASDKIVGDCDHLKPRNIRKYPTLSLPEVKRDMYIMQLQEPSAFGKKISNFSAVLEFRKSKNKDKDDEILQQYLLIKAPYISLNAISKFVSTLPLIPHCKGDELPYNSRIYLADEKPSVTPTEFEELLKLGYTSYLPPIYWSGSSSKDSLIRYHSQAVIFGLYINPSKSTIINSLIAVDYSSASLMLYSTKSSYFLKDDYSIGNALFINNKLHSTKGRCDTINPLLPNKDLDLSKDKDYIKPKLSIDTFNLIYSKISVTQTIDDIPKVDSLYEKNEIPKWVTDATHIYINSEYDFQADYNITLVEGNNVTSVLTSHLNGSISAYSIPPYGFLKELNESSTDSALKGNFSPNFTIDYVSIKYHAVLNATTNTKPPEANPKKKNETEEEKAKKPEFLVTTNKEVFNTAFSQTRDYDYYFDPKKPGFMGGFCTAAILYDFSLPKEFVNLASNYVPPKN